MDAIVNNIKLMRFSNVVKGVTHKIHITLLGFKSRLKSCFNGFLYLHLEKMKALTPNTLEFLVSLKLFVLSRYLKMVTFQ